ncbi:DHHA1 domain-containing protein, partial [Clostridioides difficile]
LNIKEVEASFVLGEKDDTIFISARSLGQINVHVLMEKLGGGGQSIIFMNNKIDGGETMEFYERAKKYEYKFTDTEDMIIEYMRK